MATEAVVKQEPRAVDVLDARKVQADIQIELAVHWAKQLMIAVENAKPKPMFTIIGGKKYLEVEAWQFVCEFAEADPIPEWVKHGRHDDGDLI